VVWVIAMSIECFESFGYSGRFCVGFCGGGGSLEKGVKSFHCRFGTGAEGFTHGWWYGWVDLEIFGTGLPADFFGFVVVVVVVIVVVVVGLCDVLGIWF